jgi:hypothetical protein
VAAAILIETASVHGQDLSPVPGIPVKLTIVDQPAGGNEQVCVSPSGAVPLGVGCSGSGVTNQQGILVAILTTARTPGRTRVLVTAGALHTTADFSTTQGEALTLPSAPLPPPNPAPPDSGASLRVLSALLGMLLPLAAVLSVLNRRVVLRPGPLATRWDRQWSELQRLRAG